MRGLFRLAVWFLLALGFVGIPAYLIGVEHCAAKTHADIRKILNACAALQELRASQDKPLTADQLDKTIEKHTGLPVCTVSDGRISVYYGVYARYEMSFIDEGGVIRLSDGSPGVARPPK